MPLAEEGLLVPFYVSGKSVGTIWAIAHNTRRKFDTEDLRLLESIGRFASAAYQTVEYIEDLKFEVAAREKAETELRGLTDGLEAQVRARTEQLEQRNKQLADARTRLAEEKLRLERSEAFLAKGQHLVEPAAFPGMYRPTRSRGQSSSIALSSSTVTRLTLGRSARRSIRKTFRVSRKRFSELEIGGDFQHESRLQMPDARSSICTWSLTGPRTRTANSSTSARFRT